MDVCKHRVSDRCMKSGFPCIFDENCFEHKEKPVRTNADRIRSMSDEELASFLEGDYGNMQIGTALNWLREPAKEV